MPGPDAKFDGLAESYDMARPRYPEALLAHAVGLLASPSPTVVDAGAGTGIALEALLPALGQGSVVHAVDISSDMVRVGRDKFPQVRWNVQPAEPFLESLDGVDLVVTAQAYQWMDRERFVRAAHGCLAPGGVCLVIQNNRHYQQGGFAAEYEELLERYSPGYRRDYRAIDVRAELGVYFPEVLERQETWEQPMEVEEFVTMSSSSTQAQRAVASIGPVFLDHVRDLCRAHEHDGRIRLPYLTEAYYGLKPR